VYHLDFACEDGFAGFVRLDVLEKENVAWYWTYLVGVPGVAGIVVVRDHEVPRPRQRLEIRAEGLWAELWCETPGEHWTFGLEAFGVRIDEPEDALRPGGEIGDRIAVGLDLEWETPDVVHGDVLVERDRFTIDAVGAFSEGEPPPVAGRVDVVARVIIPEFGERALVRAANGLRWTSLG
jgi:hypothetical protein